MCLKHPHLVDSSCSIGQTWGHIEGINLMNLHTSRHTTEVQHKLIYFDAFSDRFLSSCQSYLTKAPLLSFLSQISATGASWQLFSPVMIALLQETMAVYGRYCSHDHSHPLFLHAIYHFHSFIINLFVNFDKT